MKTLLIPKYGRRPLSLIPPFLRFPEDEYVQDSLILSKKIHVIFTESCRYILDNGDQWDWNKLTGWFWGLFGIHENSLRVAWRYNPESGHIEIALYTYEKGIRDYTVITAVPINTVCNINLEYNASSGEVSLSVICNGTGKTYKEYFAFPDKGTVFGCGLYFGGNRRAPHNIKIYEY